MTVSSVTSNAGSYPTGSLNPYQSVQTTYNQFQQNLTSGNLPGAQQVYTALVKALQNSPIGQADSTVSAPVLQSLVGVATALQSGDMNNVQSALTSLGQSINTAAQGAASGTPTQSPSTALTPAQLTSTLVSQILNAGSGSSSGSDALLSAMMGNATSNSSDPLLNALAADGTTASTATTDPLLATMASGVNIVV
jgi:hypothetical protein